MNGLTDNATSLVIHAYFDEICGWPENTGRIERLAQRIADVNPEFFTRNRLVEGECRTSVVKRLLYDFHMAGLEDDASENLLRELERFQFPDVSGEKYCGETLHRVLSEIVNSAIVRISVKPRKRMPKCLVRQRSRTVWRRSRSR